MRALAAAVVALSLSATSLFAADVPLAPGKPAGVKQAQEFERSELWWVFGGVAVFGVVVLATGNNSTIYSTTTTS
jgi:hypothetical protein